MEEKKKENEKIYRLTVWSHYEEDDGEPYHVDFDSMPDALNAKEQYESELTLSGQNAYSVCGPDIVPKEQYILIKTNGEISTVAISGHQLLDRCHELLDCCIIEIVRISHDITYIIDECGKIKRHPKEVNPICSALYAGTAYGDPIVGDVLVGIEVGADMFGYTPGILEEKLKFFNSIKKDLFPSEVEK